MSEIINGNKPDYQHQTIIIQEQKTKSNGLGIAGFVLALLALLGFWAPVLNYILWLLGLIFSAIAVFKAPRGFAIAGLCISLVSLILIIIITIGFAAIFAGL